MIEFRILGPFEASVPLPGGKPRALLARLLLDAGRVVSVDALLDALWEAPPPSAPKVLQAHVSALRKALGRDAIETRAPGYLLRPAQSDLARFEQLVEQARAERDPGARARLLREALELWRGEPLAEFRREPFAPQAAARLVELRLEALSRRIDSELELGRHEELVHELALLVERHPLRERLRAQHMLALYRCGRQVDALSVFREGRRAMVEELGLEPGPELQALERSILRQDPALAGAPPQGGPAGAVVCVGCWPAELIRPLGREVVLVEVVPDGEALADASARLAGLRQEDPSLRTACFTSRAAADDLIKLATEQEAELLLVDRVPPGLLPGAPCDVALLVEPEPFQPTAPVVVPFGGAREEWPALELAAWLARAHGLALKLLGPEATAGRRDASRMLAAASLSLQRFAGIAAEPVIVSPGADGILAEAGSLLVASLPPSGPDDTRRLLLERARVPALLVHGGLRPGRLAPERSLTRFSWSAS